MEAPVGWAREWINDECYCTALAVYQWTREGEAWRPVLRRLEFTRSLFCGSDHADEITSWQKLIDSDAPVSLAERFAMQGNREGTGG